MSIWTKIKSVGSAILGAFENIVPAQMKTELGDLASSFVANIVYDAGVLKADVTTWGEEDFAAVWAIIKQTAAKVLTDPKLATDVFSGQVGAAVTELGSDVVQEMVPGLKAVGKTTLTNFTSTAMGMLKSGVLKVDTAIADTQNSNPTASVSG